MKDYDAIAREIYRDETITTMMYYDQQEDQCIELIAAILRKHDEAETSGEPTDTDISHAILNDDMRGVGHAQLRRLFARPKPTDEKALRGEWLNAKTNPPRDAKKQVCINRNGGAFFARYAGGDWLDDDAFLRDPVLYISIPLLAREAPKDESKEGAR